MSIIDLVKNGKHVKGIFGVVEGIVTDNKDPSGMGRVKVTYPWMDNHTESFWARIATLMGGNDRGTYFIPEIGDEVLVTFSHGDLNRPYIIGSLWNSEDLPPEDNQDGMNDIKKIKSRSGHEIIFNDRGGDGKVEILSKTGHKIVLDDSESGEKIEIEDKSGNSIVIDSVDHRISIMSNMKICIEAPIIEIKADTTLTLQGSLVKIN